ncbi:hypothetical protein MMC16_003234 [Acarospora aff. strigata]|nr:hypothetical protein [Acarospora aff. strigata]
MSVFELRGTETFLWGATDGSDATLGNLTVFMPDDNENILSMEKFDGMLTSVECTPQSMTLQFEDDSSFAYAQRTWDWVNGADNHTFLMVAGKGDCGSNKYRIPYLVSSITYDETRNIARLKATAGSWKDLAHTYELRVGSVPMSSDLGLRRRDWTRDAFVDMSADFSFKSKVKTGPVSGELVCDPCFTAGKMRFEFVIKTKFKVPVGVKFRLAPDGVKARAGLKLTVASEYKSKTDLFKESIAEIPLAGISIPPDILTMGPVLDVQLGAEISAFEGAVSVLTGATATLPGNAVLEADLFDPSNNKFSSWAPSIVADDFKMQAKLSLSAKMFLEPALKLKVEALGQGLESGIGLKMPYVDVKAESIVAQGGGACKNDDPYEAALKVTSSWGFDIKFTAGNTRDKKPVDVTIGSASFPIGEPLCFPYDRKSPGHPSSLPAKPTSTSAGGSKSTPSGSHEGGDSCTVKTTGKTGTCKSTTLCKNSGGESTPGYCPDDPKNVQVSPLCPLCIAGTDGLEVLYFHPIKTAKPAQRVYGR